MEKLSKVKKCYICLPIAGKEDDVFIRADRAKTLIKWFGMEPVCPLEVNDQNKDNIDTHNNDVAKFMGNDIRILIGECDAVFVCNGWENSKGCNVEIECAKQYKKDIFWESIPKNMSIKDAIDYKLFEYSVKYNYINDRHGKDSPLLNRINNDIHELTHFSIKHFNII